MVLAFFALNCNYYPDEVLDLPRTTVMKMIASIAAMREVSAEIQNEQMQSSNSSSSDNKAAGGRIRDMDGSNLSNLNNADFVETK